MEDRASDVVRWALDALSRHRLVILVAVLLGVSATAVRVTFLVDPLFQSQSILKAEWSPYRTDARTYETCFLFFNSKKVYADAAETLGLPEKWRIPAEVCGRELSRWVEIAVIEDTHLITVNAIANSKELARQYCRAVTDAYVHERIEYHAEAVTSKDTEVEEVYRQIVKEVDYYSGLLEERNRLYATLSVEESKATPEALSFLAFTMDSAQRRAEMARAFYEILRSIPPAVRLNLPISLDFRHDDKERPYKFLVEKWSSLETHNALGLTDEHPSMKFLKAQRIKAEEMLQLEGDRIVKRALLEAILAASEAEMFKAQYLYFANQFTALDAGRFRLEMVKDTLDMQEGFMDAYQEKLLEAEVQQEIPIVTLEEISSPSDGEPKQRASWQDLLLSVAISCFFGIAIVLGVEWADSSMQVADRVERELGLKVIGFIPHHLFSRRRRSRALYAESYRLLATNTRFALGDPSHAVIILTSSGPKEGKSTTAANLAIVWSQLGKRTILLDCDLVRPTVHRIFNFDRKPGLAEYLSAPLDQPIDLPVRQHGSLDLVTGGRTKGSASLLLESSRFQALLSDLKQKYECVVLDCTPILGFSHVQTLATLADGVIMIVESGRYTFLEGNDAIRSLRKVGAQVLGVCLNKIDLDTPGRVYHGYSRYYSYYKYYHSYSKTTDQAQTGLLEVKKNLSRDHADSE